MTNSTPKPEVPITPGIWRGDWYTADGRAAWILDATEGCMLSVWRYFDGSGDAIVDYDKCVTDTTSGETAPQIIAGPFDNWPAVEAALILIRGAQ